MVKTDTLPTGGPRAVRSLRVPTPVPLQVTSRSTPIASSFCRSGPRTNKNVLPSNVQFLQQCGLARTALPMAKGSLQITKYQPVADASPRGNRACAALSNGSVRGGKGTCLGRAHGPLRPLMRSAIPVRVACQPQQQRTHSPAPAGAAAARTLPRVAWPPPTNKKGSRSPTLPDRNSPPSPALFVANRTSPRYQNGQSTALMSRNSKKEAPSGGGGGGGSVVGPSPVLPPLFATSFHQILQGAVLTIPPALLRGLERQESAALGRVKVMLRVAPTENVTEGSGSFMEIDSRQKQLTVYEPDTSLGPAEERRVGVAAPKMFAFDAIFSPDDSQDRICSKSLGDVLPAVVNGSDACVFTYGYSKLGKSQTMVGSSESVQDLGVIPCAISWLFRMIHEQKQKTGARFSVRISATEIAGKTEVLRDLLASYANGTEGCLFSPAKYLQEDPVFGMHLQNQSELRAPTADKAAFYLDAALAASRAASQESDGVTHFVFTLHVYQYRVEKSGKGGVAGGRSRLYFVDLGGCEKQSQVFSSSKSYRLSLANLGNVILAIFNGQKHVPYKDSKLTQLLREILGNITCRATMIAHVSSLPTRYTDSLATVQLASRIHRLRHKRWKNLHSGPGDSGSMDDQIHRFHRGRDGPRSSSSDVDCTSSSEQSCDTVIFVGPREKTLHEGVEAMPSSELAVPAPSITKPSFAQIRRMTALQMTDRCLPTVVPPFSSVGKLTFRPLCNMAEMTTGCPGLPRSTDLPETFRPAVDPEGKLASRPSDEFWVDGPRVNRSNFEAFRTEWLHGNLRVSGGGPTSGGVEMWVDGPQAPAPPRRCDLHFLDDHKRAMIERWIEMQTSVIQQQRRSSDCDDSTLPVEDSTPEGILSERARLDLSLKEAEIVSNVDSFVSGETEELDKGSVLQSEEFVDGSVALHLRDFVVRDYEQTEFYQRVMLHISELGEKTVASKGAPGHVMTAGSNSSENGSSDVEHPISTMDSWVQVTEDEIMLACRSLLMDDEDDDDHPLRILSSESLAISFTNSSRMSWDSGLNAMRRAFALAAATGSRAGVDGQSVELDAQSVHSDPGSVSSNRLSLAALSRSAFGSRSLDDISDLANRTHFGKQRLECCGGCADDVTDTCSCAECCSQCNFGQLRFCPEGASDPHLDRHPSALDLTDLSKVSMACPFGQKLFCGEDDLLDSCKNVHLTELSIVTSPEAVKVEPYTAKGPMNDDISPTSRNASKTTMNTASAFCCAIGFSRQTVSGGSSSGSESFQFKVPSIKSPGVQCEVTMCKLGNLVAKENFYTDCEPSPTPRLEESHGQRQVPFGLKDEKQRMVDDRGVYDSGTGSSGGSMSSGGGHKQEPKKHASLGTSSGYESMLRGSEGSDSLMSNQDSVSFSSDEMMVMMSSSKEPQQSQCGSGSKPSEKRKEVRSPGLGCHKHLGSFELIAYDEEDVERIERRRELEKCLRQRRRRSKILQLRQRQGELKKELALAKSLIMADPYKWSYDLHVEESMDADDPSFLEALQRETEILEKRVTACKSHITMVTCFDVTRPARPSTEAETSRYEEDTTDSIMSL